MCEEFFPKIQLYSVVGMDESLQLASNTTTESLLELGSVSDVSLNDWNEELSAGSNKTRADKHGGSLSTNAEPIPGTKDPTKSLKCDAKLSAISMQWGALNLPCATNLPKVFGCAVCKMRFGLAELFDKGLTYSAINCARSALSSYVSLDDGSVVGQNPLVCRLLKGGRVFSSHGHLSPIIQKFGMPKWS